MKKSSVLIRRAALFTATVMAVTVAVSLCGAIAGTWIYLNWIAKGPMEPGAAFIPALICALASALVGVLMETEVWPNLVAGCQRAGVPLVLTNARLNAQSFAGAKRWSALSRPAYAALAAVLAQTTQDAERLRQLGAPQPSVLGNLKFDVQPDPALLALGASWRSASRRPVAKARSSVS